MPKPTLLNTINQRLGYKSSYLSQGTKVNVIARLVFELAYYDVAIKHVNHCPIRLPPPAKVFSCCKVHASFKGNNHKQLFISIFTAAFVNILPQSHPFSLHTNMHACLWFIYRLVVKDYSRDSRKCHL